MSAEVHVTCVDNEADFSALAEDWNQLARITLPECVFLRHEWFDAAWQWLSKEDCRLSVICIYSSEFLTGIVPLIQRRAKVRGVPVNSLESMTVPDTQYYSVLCAPPDIPAVAEAVFDFLCASNCRWDRFVLDKIEKGNASIYALLRTAQNRKLTAVLKPNGCNPALSLAKDWQSYYGCRSRRLKKGNNHIANKLLRAEKQPELRWLHGETISSEMLPALIDTLSALSSASWKKKTGLTLDCPEPRAFIERLSYHAQREGWLSVWILELDGKAAAAELQLIHEGVVSALRADYDLDFEEWSPGAYMNWKLLENLFAKGLRHYCMGPGDSEYKMRWAEETVFVQSLVIYNHTWPGRTAGWLDLTLYPQLRRWTKK